VVALILALAVTSRGERTASAEEVGHTRSPSVDVAVEAIKGSLSLKVTITSRTTVPIEIYRSDLPWGSFSSLLLVAATGDRIGAPLDRRNPIDDPGTSRVVLKPGEVLAGDVDLADQFPALPDALKEREVILFWSYRPRLADGGLLPRHGGWLILEATQQRPRG
jgi:hypothetical protein